MAHWYYNSHLTSCAVIWNISKKQFKKQRRREKRCRRKRRCYNNKSVWKQHVEGIWGKPCFMQKIYNICKTLSELCQRTFKSWVAMKPCVHAERVCAGESSMSACRMRQDEEGWSSQIMNKIWKRFRANFCKSRERHTNIYYKPACRRNCLVDMHICTLGPHTEFD